MSITITWAWWQILLALIGVGYLGGAIWAFRWTTGIQLGFRIRMIAFWPLTLLAALFGNVQ